MLIAPPCPTCHRTHHDPITAPPWASLSLLSEGVVTFEEAPPDAGAWRRAPAQGSTVQAVVRFPFSAALGEPVWALFEPWHAVQNGWSDSPEELSQIALLQVRPLEDLGPREQGRHAVRLHVQAVLPVTALEDIFPPQPVPALGTCMGYGPDSFSHIWRVSHGDWHHLSWSAQGDVGGWLLFHGEHLLLAGEWDFHTAAAYAGVGVVDPAQRAALLARAQ